jgi:hypothetical protein
MPENMSDKIPNSISIRTPKDMSDKMPNKISENILKDMSNKMSKNISNKISNNLLITKYINIMIYIKKKTNFNIK